MSYSPSSSRYDAMQYRTSGRSGLKLPAISLGLWHNFGHDTQPQRSRDILFTAFDLGITISTSPTIMARRPAPPRSSSAPS